MNTTNATTINLGFVGDDPLDPTDRRQQIVFDPTGNRLVVLEEPRGDGSWVCSPVVARGRRATPVILSTVEMDRAMAELSIGPQSTPAEVATMWLGAMWGRMGGGVTAALGVALAELRIADDTVVQLTPAARRHLYQRGATTRFGLDSAIGRLVEHGWLHPLPTTETGERWRLVFPDDTQTPKGETGS